MSEMNAKKLITLTRVLLGLAGICFLIGFFLAASDVEYVFVGILVMMIAGTGLIFIALIFMVRLVQAQNRQKEERIKKLEEEVELLKKR